MLPVSPAAVVGTYRRAAPYSSPARRVKLHCHTGGRINSARYQKKSMHARPCASDHRAPRGTRPANTADGLQASRPNLFRTALGLGSRSSSSTTLPMGATILPPVGEGPPTGSVRPGSNICGAQSRSALSHGAWTRALFRARAVSSNSQCARPGESPVRQWSVSGWAPRSTKTGFRPTRTGSGYRALGPSGW